MKRLLLLTPLVLLVPRAEAATPQTVVPIEGEAWFTVSPTCGTPLGCEPIPGVPLTTATVYPAGTLHVAAQLGSESARTYLPLPLQIVPDGATLTGATLTVPIDTSPTSGTVSADTSKVEACVTTVTISPSTGSTDTPPPVDCTKAVPATYSATPAPQLSFDLRPMLDQLAQPNTSLALIPVPGESLTDTWHVAFSSSERDPQTPPSATLAITTTGGAVPSPSDAGPTSSAPSRAPSTSPAPPATTTAPVVTPPEVTVPDQTLTVPPTGDSSPEPAPVVAGPSSDAPAPVQAVEVSRTVGFAYPWLLVAPIAIAAGLMVLGRHLTRDMRPGTGPTEAPWRALVQR